MSTSTEVTAKVTFSMLRGKVGDRLLDAIESMGFTEPTEIQAKTLPHLLLGKDLIGAAKSGSGKTLAFLIPTIELLDKMNFAPVHGTGCIILTPTREQVHQTHALLENMLQFVVPLSCARANGGTNKRHEAERLAQGKNIVVTTPGRLLTHLRTTPEKIKFSNLKILVINVGDARKLEYGGFDSDYKGLIELLPKERQTVIFSTTVTERIRNLADLLMTEERVCVTIDSSQVTSTSSVLTQGISPRAQTTMSMNAQGHNFNGAIMKEQHISTCTITNEKYITPNPKAQPADLETFQERDLPTESHKFYSQFQQRKEEIDTVKTQSIQSEKLLASSSPKYLINKPTTSAVCQLQSERTCGLIQNKPNALENFTNDNFYASTLRTVSSDTTISSVNISQVVISQDVQKSSEKGTIFQADTPNMKRIHTDNISPPIYSKQARIESSVSLADQQRVDAIDMAVMTVPPTDLTAQRAEKIIDRVSEEYIKWTLDAIDATTVFFERHAFYAERDEAIKLRCANEGTVDWLKKTVQSLVPIWPGCKLITKKCSELTKYIKCGLFAPKWKYGIDSLRKFLAGANPNLKVNEWVLYDYDEVDKGFFLTVGIPETTVINEVVPNHRLVYYVLGSIYIQFFNARGKLVTNYPADCV